MSMDVEESERVDMVDCEVPLAYLMYEQASGGELRIPIYPGKDIKVGRDETLCDPVIPNDLVSKQHFRVYSIIYELDNTSELPPLIYCEDLETTNGTFVNNECIGMICRERQGYLLTHNDVIEVRPHWRFRFHQPFQSILERDWLPLKELRYFDGQYKVSDRMLGKGHYGAVFLAKEVSTRQQLACKIVNLESAAQAITENMKPDVPGRKWHDAVQRAKEGRKIVLREINLLSKLSHPHIINLKRAFCTDHSVYMFTELAPGGDLFSYIESQGGLLSDWHSRIVTRQIVLAIQYMHSNGIVHRDIKPENVLIMQTAFGGRVVLTDFGFANYVHAKTGRLQSKLGTEGFIAPEIEFMDTQSGGYTMAADMWSLGVLTVCLLTGRPLIPHIDMCDMNQQHQAERFSETTNRYVSSEWQFITRRALNFLRGLLTVDPSERMNATQSLDHAWFKAPATEAVLLEEGHKRVTRFWKKRDAAAELIEDLSGGRTSSEKEPKLRRKLPDATLSTYFGLDRHLQQVGSSQRRNVLEDLNASGSLFLASHRSQRDHTAGDSATTMDEDSTVQSVSGSNLFGEYCASETAIVRRPSKGEDEFSL